MIVPLSDAVAITVPSLLNVMQDKGDLCASTTLMASSFIASKMRISPEVGDIWVLFGGTCAGAETAFCGNGYAR